MYLLPGEYMPGPQVIDEFENATNISIINNPSIHCCPNVNSRCLKVPTLYGRYTMIIPFSIDHL